MQGALRSGIRADPRTGPDIDPLGSAVRLRLALGDGDDRTSLTLATFSESHLARPVVGTTVAVSFPPETCFVVEGSEPALAPRPAATIDAEV